MKVKKAVIAVAGFGTRFLPATKTIPKEMLPIINKPAIQYVVEELAAAGIEEIIFVTNWQKGSIENHFDHSFELENQLIKQGKANLVAELKEISNLARFVYVRQIDGYGNALPVITAKALIGDEPFIYAFSDDLVKSPISFSQQLIETYQQHRCSVIGVQAVGSEEVAKYGIVSLKADTSFLADIVEKPPLGQAPSNLASFGRYLFTPDIFAALEKIQLGKDSEYWIVDAIKILARTHPVMTKEIDGGKWLTTGDPVNYFKTLLEYAKDHEELKALMHYEKID